MEQRSMMIMRSEERFCAFREAENYSHEPSEAVEQEDPMIVKTILKQLAKRAEQKAFSDHSQRQSHQQPDGGHKGPYLHSTFLAQQRQHPQPILHIVHSPVPNSTGTIDHHQHAYIARRVTPMRKHVVAPLIIDSKKAAEIYGGVEVTYYGKKY